MSTKPCIPERPAEPQQPHTLNIFKKYGPALQILALALLVAALPACTDTGTTPGNTTGGTRTGILTTTADNVVTPTNSEVQQMTGDLHLASVEFKNGTRTQAQLNAIADLWKNSKSCWEVCEAFAHGPMGDQRQAVDIKTWPVLESGIDRVINEDFELTRGNVFGLPANYRGFHAVEYMLFRNGQVRSASELGDRDAEFLALTTELLDKQVKEFCQIWTNGMANHFKNAGQMGSSFRSPEMAICQSFNGMGLVSNALATQHLEQMRHTHRSQKWASSYSQTSVNDIKQCLAGIKHLMMGNVNQSGASNGLANWLGSRSQNANARLQVQLSTAINAVDDIPSYYDNQADWVSKVEKAREETAKIQNIIQEEVMPLFPGRE